MPVQIETLDNTARGLTQDGQAIPRTLPGEEVEPGDPPRILTPSSDRVTAPCAHFKRCGGCALQHASDSFVAAWKLAQVKGALSRAGLDASVTGPATSPPRSRRRASLKGRKTKKGAQIGLHAARSHDLVAIPDCQLLHPDIMAALPTLERLTRFAAPRGGEVGLHVTRTETGLDLAVTDAKAVETHEIATFASAFARITWNGEPMLMATQPMLSLGPARVTPPPRAFLQATAEGEAALIAAIQPAVQGAARIADLFSGLGTFTFPAAVHAPVDAYEGDSDLIGALQDGVRHVQGLKAITAQRRDLFREPLLPEELAAYDTVILDPPRAGAQAQIAELARSRVARIAHVSCNPGTFARDAATLIASGYRLGEIQVVDQFRWSPHIELVATFEQP